MGIQHRIQHIPPQNIHGRNIFPSPSKSLRLQCHCQLCSVGRMRRRRMTEVHHSQRTFTPRQLEQLRVFQPEQGNEIFSWDNTEPASLHSHAEQLSKTRTIHLSGVKWKIKILFVSFLGSCSDARLTRAAGVGAWRSHMLLEFPQTLCVYQCHLLM